jgi:hypothetical protein
MLRDDHRLAKGKSAKTTSSIKVVPDCGLILPERIQDSNSVDLPSFLQIFGEKHTTPGLFRSSQDQSIPEGKPVKPVQVDRRKDIRHLRGSNVELGQQFDLPAGNPRIDMQLSRDGYKVLLEHLQGHNPSPRTPVFSHEIESASLFRWRTFVVRVDQNIGIEEATSAHESRLD